MITQKDLRHFIHPLTGKVDLQGITDHISQIRQNDLKGLVAELDERMFQIREHGTGETHKEHKALSDFKTYLSSLNQ